MKIVSIDPGYDRLGVAVMEHDSTGRESLLYSTCIETDKNQELPERIFMAGEALEHIIAEHTPDAVAVETLFFNKNQKTAIGVAQMRGIILYLAKKAGCTLYEFGPQEIKVATTGYGNSDKSAVIMMVQQLIANAPKKALDDEYDAIAVGITCLAHHR